MRQVRRVSRHLDEPDVQDLWTLSKGYTSDLLIHDKNEDVCSSLNFDLNF